MIQLDDCLTSKQPSIREERAGKTLLIWGDLGQWLVLDKEAVYLLDCFQDKQTVKAAVECYARHFDKRMEDIIDETLAIVDAFAARGILGWPPPVCVPPSDPLLLSNLTFNITNKCNLHCQWCYNPTSNGNDIPISDIINWLARDKESLDRDASLIILGGEPFLDERRLLDCLRGANEIFAREVLVSTNGTILSPTTSAELKKTNTTVQISLDGATPDTHDAIRGDGSFLKAVTTAQRLIDAEVRTILSLVLNRRNEAEMEAYFDLAASIGAHEVRFIPLRRIGKGSKCNDLTPDLFASFKRLVNILKRRPQFGKMLQRDYFSILMSVCRFSHLRENCGIARRCLFIDADGSIFPCPNHRGSEYHCGNIYQKPLAGILTDSRLMQSLRSLYSLENMTICSECAYRFWCAGDCRAEALAVNGDPKSPSPYCNDIKNIMREIFWLISEGWQTMAGRENNTQPWS
jgi:radical SAM protein with 4Fe4S-binding SPASM domain